MAFGLLDTDAAAKELEALALSIEAFTKGSGHLSLSDRPMAKVMESVTQLRSAIERLAPPGTTYRRAAEESAKRHAYDPGGQVAELVGIVRAMALDYRGGKLQNFVELVHADVFSDFLEMAKYLLESKYKDAAAVIAGSTLEAHLRALCVKNSIPLVDGAGAPAKADTLNVELRKASNYNLLDQKSVTAWLGIRNDAAHGNYGNYTASQVDLMIQAIRDFIARTPA